MARVIDTSVWVDVERRGQFENDFGTITSVDEAIIASVTAAELLMGAELGQRRGERRHTQLYVESLLDRLTILPFDLAAARIYARLYGEIRRSGNTVGVSDLQIATIAMAHDSSVVTLNLRDFNRIPGLTVVAPAWA